MNILQRADYYFKRIKTAFVLLKKPFGVKVFGDYFKLSSIVFDVSPSSSLVLELGVGASISNTIFYVRGKSCKVRIGAKVKIRKSLVWLEDDNCQLEIGECSTAEDVKFYLTEKNSKIILGYDCMLATDIEFRTGDSHSIFDLVSSERINKPENIVIGDRNWIGSHSKLLKGVKTENDVIIGLGSVVTGRSKLQAFCIYAGNPVKKIKSNVIWDRKR